MAVISSYGLLYYPLKAGCGWPQPSGYATKTNRASVSLLQRTLLFILLPLPPDFWKDLYIHALVVFR